MAREPSSMGEQVTFNEGDTIYEQGSPSEGVYMILDGQIDIWRDEGENSHHIAALGSGDLLGEVSVIERKDHSVTARASKNTIALFISAEGFRKSFSDPLVRHVVHTLAARLRSSYAVKESIESGSDQPVTFKSKLPTIESGSRIIAQKLLTFIELKEFPFLVGNVSNAEGNAVVATGSLKIPLAGVPNLSSDHFEIVRRDGGLMVRDLGGGHGTIVNGTEIRKYAMSATAKLKIGKNTVVAGGADSSVRFTILVPPEFGVS